MSDPTFRGRPSTDPRVSIDLDDIERRLRESLDPVPASAPAPAPFPVADPLAELARLVGASNPDPFSRVFSHPSGLGAPPSGERVLPIEPPPVASPTYAGPAYGEPSFGAPPYRASYQAPQPDPLPPGPAYDYAYQAQHAQRDQHDYEPTQQPQGEAAWMDQPQYDPYADYAEEQPRKTGRAKLLIGAAIVVAAGGLASAFVLRGGGSGGEAPVILANSGPVKMQPAQPVGDPSKPNISVLERGVPASKDSKLVQSEEQPVDLGAAARSNNQRPPRAGEPGAPVTLAPPPPPPVANSLFAEPKKVKAIAVRPDGSIIDPNTPAAPAPASTAPKLADKPAAAPAGKPTDMASLVASTANLEPPKAVARAPEAKPVAAPVPAARPANAAPMNINPAAAAAPLSTPSTAPITTASATSGTYAVQLVGTTSSDEAKAGLERVNTKYRSDLGAYRPTIVKEEVGGRTVFRVRVINLSSDDANKLCAKLKASGGTCFVARS